MVLDEPWKASALEVHLLRTTDGSVVRGLDPNKQRKMVLIVQTNGSEVSCCLLGHSEAPETIQRTQKLFAGHKRSFLLKNSIFSLTSLRPGKCREGDEMDFG